jgi:uncharacterized membrane protein YuzA (DUF378 family)
MAKDWLIKTTGWLTAIGAINWGLLAWFNMNLVDYLPTSFAKWVYTAIAASAIYVVVLMLKK